MNLDINPTESNDYEYATGWHICKFLFVIVGIINLIPRFYNIPFLYCDECLRLTSDWYRLNDFYQISIFQANIICSTSIVGLILILRGGVWHHIGILIWLVTNITLLSSQGINIKAYDRLLIWYGIILLISPAYKKNLLTIQVLKFPRYLMLILFSSLYLSTGILKLLYEPGWFDGSAMMYHLNHRLHAGGGLALWLSTQNYLLVPLGILTVFFECSAGVLLWIRAFNPYVLIVGVVFHVGIELLMNVGTFTLVVLAAYPILFEPSFCKLLVSLFSKNLN